jgi:hypothetical protein
MGIDARPYEEAMYHAGRRAIITATLGWIREGCFAASSFLPGFLAARDQAVGIHRMG